MDRDFCLMDESDRKIKDGSKFFCLGAQIRMGTYYQRTHNRRSNITNVTYTTTYVCYIYIGLGLERDPFFCDGSFGVFRRPIFDSESQI